MSMTSVKRKKNYLSTSYFSKKDVKVFKQQNCGKFNPEVILSTATSVQHSWYTYLVEFQYEKIAGMYARHRKTS